MSQALVAFTIDYEAAGKGVLPVVANTLRLVPDEGVPLASLPMTFGLSGNGKTLLERHRIATVESDSATGRKVVRLTDVGREERDGYQPTLARIIEQWNRRYGEALVSDLSHSLHAVVVELDPGLPHYPMVEWKGSAFTDSSAAHVAE